MKKKIIISAIIIILLIAFLPFPQKIERTYYGYDTFSGDSIEVTLDMKYLRFLLLKDKMSGEIRVTNGDEVTVYSHGLSYVGMWPLIKENEDMHVFTGWYFNSYGGKTLDSDIAIVYISKDFTKMTIYHVPENKDYKTKQYVCNIEDNKLEETIEYFGGFITDN